VKGWSYPGRWALVTGASAGIGACFAEALAARGMHLVLSARRLDRLDALAARLANRFGVRAVSVAADLADPAGAGRLWHEASRYGPIDLLINNAGFGVQGPFASVPLDRHAELVQVNVGSAVELAHHALTSMLPRGDGGIINVASIASFQPVPLLATYAASKAFLLSFSEALWAEYRDSGIRVLALCPGRTPTEFQQVAGTGSVEGAFGHRTPEQVVEIGLRAFERGGSHVVPGWENLAATWASRALPRTASIRAMRRVVRRLWEG